LNFGLLAGKTNRGREGGWDQEAEKREGRLPWKDNWMGKTALLITAVD